MHQTLCSVRNTDAIVRFMVWLVVPHKTILTPGMGNNNYIAPSMEAAA
jgi:hypothetical protein